jgi:hypothetical protein
MKVEHLTWQDSRGWSTAPSLQKATVVIYFAAKRLLEDGNVLKEVRRQYPQAILLGCSSGGEIYKGEVQENTLVITAIEPHEFRVKSAQAAIHKMEDSFAVGKHLGEALKAPDLKSIFVLSVGSHVIGSDLVKGFFEMIPEHVIVTGGFAADMDAQFGQTFVGLDESISDKVIAAVGFYGDSVEVSYGSVGGWDPFGPERVISKAENNILYELDGKPALKLYKEYLGEEAKDLPRSALHFPLNIRPDKASDHDIVRTIIGVNEEDQSLIFAGDVPQGYVARLMKGDFNHLIDGAEEAASLAMKHSSLEENEDQKAVALLVSCIGRKVLMGQSVADEVEAIEERFDNRISTIGYYSYGEIGHHRSTGKCGFHNQTMTITLLSERTQA